VTLQSPAFELQRLSVRQTKLAWDTEDETIRDECHPAPLYSFRRKASKGQSRNVENLRANATVRAGIRIMIQDRNAAKVLLHNFQY
jgi:hypothetical protein